MRTMLRLPGRRKSGISGTLLRQYSYEFRLRDCMISYITNLHDTTTKGTRNAWHITSVTHRLYFHRLLLPY